MLNTDGAPDSVENARVADVVEILWKRDSRQDHEL